MSATQASPRQLVLALDHATSFARDDFLAGPSNTAALALVESWPDWPNRVMALVGPEGAGKTHLASIWADAAGARVLSARLLEHGNLPDPEGQAIDELKQRVATLEAQLRLLAERLELEPTRKP